MPVYPYSSTTNYVPFPIFVQIYTNNAASSTSSNTPRTDPLYSDSVFSLRREATDVNLTILELLKNQDLTSFTVPRDWASIAGLQRLRPGLESENSECLIMPIQNNSQDGKKGVKFENPSPPGSQVCHDLNTTKSLNTESVEDTEKYMSDADSDDCDMAINDSDIAFKPSYSTANIIDAQEAHLMLVNQRGGSIELPKKRESFVSPSLDPFEVAEHNFNRRRSERGVNSHLNEADTKGHKKKHYKLTGSAATRENAVTSDAGESDGEEEGYEEESAVSASQKSEASCHLNNAKSKVRVSCRHENGKSEVQASSHPNNAKSNLLRKSKRGQDARSVVIKDMVRQASAEAAVEKDSVPPPLKKKKAETDEKEESDSKFEDYQKRNWSEMYANLCEFRLEQGHCRVPFSYKKSPELARWVKRQRYQYSLFDDKGGKRPASMTADRIKALNDIGFCWDPQSAIWQEHFAKLKDFKDEFGHCNVPASYTENQKLAIWVKCQRRQYKLYRQGKASVVNPVRVKQLESLEFQWVMRSVRSRSK